MYIPIYQLNARGVAVLRWDTATTTGIQDGTGTWGTSAFWTQDGGATRGAWISGSIARFGGGSSGTAGNISGTPSTTINLAGIIFDQPFAGNYTLQAATGYLLNFVGQSTIVCNFASTINATLSGGTITLLGTATLTFANSSVASTNTGWNIAAGATLTVLNNSNIPLGSKPVEVNGTLNLAAQTAANTINAVISGTGAVNTSTAVGSGSVTVLSDCTFTGTWTHLAGSQGLLIGNGGSTGSVGPCQLVLNATQSMDINRTGAWTMAANVSGTGTTRFLRGDTTLTGSWTAGAITVGVSTTTTIRIGAGGTTGSVSSNLAVSTSPTGNVIFNRSNSYTYSGVISGGGTGTVTHSGSGTLTFSANHTFTGTYYVNGGAPLRLGGNIAGSIVVNNIAGSTVGCDTAVTRTVGGSITFFSNSGLDVQTNGSTVASRLTVTGGVVRGGAKVNVLGALNVGSYIIISGSAAASSGTDFTIGTNLSGRTLSVSTVLGITTLTAS